MLSTKRLHIRKINSDDWESIKEIWDDFSISPLSQYDAPHTSLESEIKRKVHQMAIDSQDNSNVFFCVILNDLVIGYVDFHDTGNGMDLGYCFHSAYQGYGYAKESCKSLIEYFQTLGVKRFTAGTALDNVPSVKLLHSLGFEQIGNEKVSFHKDENENDIVFDGGIFELII